MTTRSLALVSESGELRLLTIACIIIGSLTFGITCVEPNYGGSWDLVQRGKDRTYGVLTKNVSESCHLKIGCVPPRETLDNTYSVR